MEYEYEQKNIALRLVMMMRMVGRLRLSSIMWLNGCHKLAASPNPTLPTPIHSHTLHSPKSTNTVHYYNHNVLSRAKTKLAIHHSKIAP